MAYVVALTKSKYQYKLSIPTRLVDSVGMGRERVVVLCEGDDKSIIIKLLERGENDTDKDHKP